MIVLRKNAHILSIVSEMIPSCLVSGTKVSIAAQAAQWKPRLN